MSIVVNPISPVAVSLFGLNIRWYALAYIISFILSFILFKKMIMKVNSQYLSKKQFDDLLNYVVLGVIIGGRLGYVLFYNLNFYLNNPLEIFMIWHGGMSFHGGLLGFVFSVYYFAKHNFKTKLYYNFFYILDRLSIVAPIGLFFGRIANFINMEVMGRVTNSKLGIIFRGSSDFLPRHPSPIYEALTEGILLFVIMNMLYKFTKLKEYSGCLSGIFAILYSIFRIFCEQFRQPDEQIGFLTSWGLTMGQLLSGCLFILGIIVIIASINKKNKN